MDPELVLLYGFLALLGLLLGSFYNVVIYRYQAGVSIVRPRSYCPRCGSTLQGADLVPVFSYLLLRGRCRYCRSPIPFRYPLVELGSALLLVAAFRHFGLSPDLLKHFALLSLLLIISLIDLDIQKIPNVLVGAIAAWALLWQALHPARPWADAALGLLAGGGITLLIALISRGGMGGGDIKLLAALGFLTGWLDLLLLFFIAVILGAVVGIFLVVFQRKGGQTAVPFGPFIAGAYAIVLFWGEGLWEFYLATFIR